MVSKKEPYCVPGLEQSVNEEKKRQALRKRCEQYRDIIQKKDPYKLARSAALSIRAKADGSFILCGDHYLETHEIHWPELSLSKKDGNPVTLQTEALWLHYLARANGRPLTGRWVNLSEIGGLFYQQAFQGYCGDKLAEAWGDNIENLRNKCLASGGWPIAGLADLAFEWRALPRLPLCLCYRLSPGTKKSWATMLFDAAVNQYVAADVAAVVGKSLADRLMPHYS